MANAVLRDCRKLHMDLSNGHNERGYAEWLSPDRRLGSHRSPVLRVWDLETGQTRLTLLTLPDDRWLPISHEGHYRTNHPKIERDIRHVVQTDDGVQHPQLPEEFTQKYGWKNDQDQMGAQGRMGLKR